MSPLESFAALMMVKVQLASGTSINTGQVPLLSSPCFTINTSPARYQCSNSIATTHYREREQLS